MTHEGRLTAEEALKIMNDIDAGVDPIVEREDWAKIWCGNVMFTSKAGHKVVVFSRCHSWNYIDKVQSSDGRVFDYGDYGDCDTEHESNLIVIRRHPATNFTPQNDKMWFGRDMEW